MRELQSIKVVLNKALEQARTANAAQIKNIRLALGEISELDQASIQEHWNELSKDTVAENAGLHFHIITAEVQCMSCFKKYHPSNGIIHCANCGSYGAKILSGEEFHIETIEMDFE